MKVKISHGVETSALHSIKKVGKREGDMNRKKNILELTNCSVSEYRKMEKLPVIVLLDNVRSMYNVGSVLRTCDAFMISEVVLCGITGCPPHPEITKTALGADESVEWHHEKDAVEAVEKFQREGWTVCVLEQAHGSIPLQRLKPLVCLNLNGTDLSVVLYRDLSCT